jgi:AraC-like DNA-binding protein
LQGRAARLLREALSKLPLPSGVWCGEDLAARRVCEIAHAAGLRIPEDIAVLGLGDYRAAECGSPQISSIPLLGERIGYRAFAALDRTLSGEGALSPLTPVPPPPIVVRESTAGTTSLDPLQSCRQFISDHCAEGITVKQVATVAGLSPQILHARFLKRFGCSPGEAIRQARLAVAKRYLQDPRLSILRVADLCGFNQSSKFSNFFHRETGFSPREWRKRNQ